MQPTSPPSSQPTNQSTNHCWKSKLKLGAPRNHYNDLDLLKKTRKKKKNKTRRTFSKATFLFCFFKKHLKQNQDDLHTKPPYSRNQLQTQNTDLLKKPGKQQIHWSLKEQQKVGRPEHNKSKKKQPKAGLFNGFAKAEERKRRPLNRCERWPSASSKAILRRRMESIDINHQSKSKRKTKEKYEELDFDSWTFQKCNLESKRENPWNVKQVNGTTKTSSLRALVFCHLCLRFASISVLLKVTFPQLLRSLVAHRLRSFHFDAKEEALFGGLGTQKHPPKKVVL